MNIFQAIGTVVSSLTGFITSSARTLEKSVLLIEVEVDGMHDGDTITVKPIAVQRPS